MTDLQKLYMRFRTVDGLKHRATLRAMAVETSLDEQTISRALARARREDERAAKRSKRS